MKPLTITYIVILLGVTHISAGPKKYGNEATVKPLEPVSDTTDNKTVFRNSMTLTIFPNFEFKGKFKDAIKFLAQKSQKFNPEGMPIGGFSIRAGVLTDNDVDLKLNKVNALDVINALCKEINATWRIGSHSLIIEPKNIQALIVPTKTKK